MQKKSRLKVNHQLIITFSSWDFFLTDLNLIPKSGKKDFSSKKSWRPISIGSSENWVLEKVFLKRLYPYSRTSDSQFGYKENHSTSHAIEIVRTIERSYDAHICLLDASSAFDKLSWQRIRDQLIKRNVPYTFVKLILSQLCYTKIRICNTNVLFPRIGVKQGGVLSGVLFSWCYDDLVYELERTGIGILIKTISSFIVLCILVYADDILLISASPSGLKTLIKRTFTFATKYGDITFNTSKSWILRVGPHNKPPVSVCGIPTTECHEYLGVEIGRKADSQKRCVTQLYSNSNKLFVQNKCLHKCSISVKNMCISSYGNVYCLENELSISSKLRNAHRYMTKSVHTSWPHYADLDGPNIRSRRLYSVFQLDSLEVIHRRRRNYFLIKASTHENKLIADIIGNLPRITFEIVLLLFYVIIVSPFF